MEAIINAANDELFNIFDSFNRFNFSIENDYILFWFGNKSRKVEKEDVEKLVIKTSNLDSASDKLKVFKNWLTDIGVRLL